MRSWREWVPPWEKKKLQRKRAQAKARAKYAASNNQNNADASLGRKREIEKRNSGKNKRTITFPEYTNPNEPYTKVGHEDDSFAHAAGNSDKKQTNRAIRVPFQDVECPNQKQRVVSVGVLGEESYGRKMFPPLPRAQTASPPPPLRLDTRQAPFLKRDVAKHVL